MHLSVNLPYTQRARRLYGIVFSGFGPAYISLPVLKLGPRYSTLQPRVPHRKWKGGHTEEKTYTGEKTYMDSIEGGSWDIQRGNTCRGDHTGGDHTERRPHGEETTRRRGKWTYGEETTREGDYTEKGERTYKREETGHIREVPGTNKERGLHVEGTGEWREGTHTKKEQNANQQTTLFYFYFHIILFVAEYYILFRYLFYLE